MESADLKALAFSAEYDKETRTHTFNPPIPVNHYAYKVNVDKMIDGGEDRRAFAHVMEYGEWLYVRDLQPRRIAVV